MDGGPGSRRGRRGALDGAGPDLGADGVPAARHPLDHPDAPSGPAARTSSPTPCSSPARFRGRPGFRVSDAVGVQFFERAGRNWFATVVREKERTGATPHTGTFAWPLEVGKTWTSTYQYRDNQRNLRYQQRDHLLARDRRGGGDRARGPLPGPATRGREQRQPVDDVVRARDADRGQGDPRAEGRPPARAPARPPRGRPPRRAGRRSLVRLRARGQRGRGAPGRGPARAGVLRERGEGLRGPRTAGRGRADLHRGRAHRALDRRHPAGPPRRAPRDRAPEDGAPHRCDPRRARQRLRLHRRPVPVGGRRAPRPSSSSRRAPSSCPRSPPRSARPSGRGCSRAALAEVAYSRKDFAAAAQLGAESVKQFDQYLASRSASGFDQNRRNAQRNLALALTVLGDSERQLGNLPGATATLNRRVQVAKRAGGQRARARRRGTRSAISRSPRTISRRRSAISRRRSGSRSRPTIRPT